MALDKPALRERLKRVQALAIQATGHPLMPAAARACIAETTLLLSDLVADVEKLKFYLDTLREEIKNGD